MMNAVKIGTKRGVGGRTHYVPRHWWNSEVPFPLALCGVAIPRKNLAIPTKPAECPDCRRIGKAYGGFEKATK